MAAVDALSLFVRASVNAGALAGTAVVTEENEKNDKNISSRGRIIGIIVGSVILVLLIVFAVCYDRSKKRKARQGTKLKEMGADEEARPMVQGPDGVPRPLVMQTGGSYFPPQADPMYAGNGYGQGPVHMPPGQQGADFYRNQ